MNLLELITYFIIYSFLGWVMECIFRSICERRIINTGFLKGPFCPIYGIGALIMFLFLDRFENKIVILFFISLLLLSLWEYLVAILMEKLFSTKYWDYSHKKFNIQGRVSLDNSICWGILGVVFIKFIHPFIKSNILNINENIVVYVTYIILIVIIIDMVTTVVNLKNMKSALEKVEKLNREIKEKIKEFKAIGEEKLSTSQNIQLLISKMKKRRDKRIMQIYKNAYRLKNAFPAINTKEITEILNKKIEIIRNRKDENRDEK